MNSRLSAAVMASVLSAVSFAHPYGKPVPLTAAGPIIKQPSLLKPGLRAGILAVTPAVKAPLVDSRTILIKVGPAYQAGLVNTPLGASEVKNFGFGNWRLIQISASMPVATALATYAKIPGVVAVEPNYCRPINLDVNDPQRNACWHLNMVNVPGMWDSSIGTKAVSVAILDTGVNYNHPDLKANIIPGGKDFANEDDDPMDVQGHGTHCAGDASAVTNNGIGVASAGYNVGILPMKCGLDGEPFILTAAWMDATKYATDLGVKVISMSFGGPGKSQAEQDAVNYAWNHGAIVTASAGNDNTDAALTPNYPANLDNVLSIAATNQLDQKADFSSYGKTKIDVAAPGVDILSTTVDGAYGRASGTSMANPFTAGIIGQMFCYLPTATNQEVIDAITSTALPKNFVIYGRVDAAAAIVALVPVVFADCDITAAGAYPGTAEAGLKTTVASNDGIFLTPTAGYVKGVGQVSAVQIRYQQNPDTVGKQILSAAIDYKVKSNFAGTVQLFRKDPIIGNWIFVGQSAYSSTNKHVDFSFDPNRDVISSGKVELMLRMIVPSNIGGSSGLEFGVDSAKFSLRFRNKLG